MDQFPSRQPQSQNRLPITAVAFLIAIAILVLARCLPATGPAISTPVAATTAAAEAQTAPSPTLTPEGTEGSFETQLPMVASSASPEASAPTETAPPTPELAQDEKIRFAVIGDYGLAGQNEQDVATLVKSWNPDFILTTGDNNYPDGAYETIDENIGQYYQEFIGNYQGSYGPGASENLFFPTLGNHDYVTGRAQPYFDYFTLPGNERYYDFTWGPVHFFALNSNSQEEDGVGASSVQAAWLRERLAQSTTPWQIVYMHHPPYSSGTQGSVDWTRWPYQEWGADAVLSGHDHTYERLLVDGLPYFINGVGGGAIYAFEETLEGSQVRFRDDYGAMLVEASEEQVTFQFFTRQEALVDSFFIEKP